MTLFDKITRTIDVLDRSSCTRNTIAENIGISLSSVNTVVNELKSARVIGEFSSSDRSPGRNQGILHLRNEPVFAFADISESKIITTVFGFGLDIKNVFSYGINDPVFFDDSLLSYFRTLSGIRPKFKYLFITSAGIPQDGFFSGTGISNLDNVPICSIAKEFLYDTKIILDNKADYICEDTSGVYAIINDSDGMLNIEIFSDGRSISSRYITPELYGNTSGSFATLYKNRLKYAASFPEYTDTLVHITDTLTSFISFDRIYYYTDRYSSVDLLVNEIRLKARDIKDIRILPIVSDNMDHPLLLLKKVREIALKDIFNIP